ncbi:MAG: CoA-binding protein [Actinobacteria bacterium]|jgi:succinyl-CoA synthetase alpha subunit|nr:CoA-binding protein [Actinomycetota bacterium]
MSVVVSAATRVAVQGITGGAGAMFARRMLDDGTAVRAGIVPGRGGTTIHGIPVFDTVFGAREAVNVDTSLICVPGPAVYDAFCEAVAAGISTVVVYTEGVPAVEAAKMVTHARATGVRLLGPASAGIVTPGVANISDLRSDFVTPGPVGIVSRSGTLTYEVIAPLADLGIGVSTVCCLGGDACVGTSFTDVLPLFDRDPATEVVVLLGEIGGLGESDAAKVVRTMKTPVVAYVAGRGAPPGQRLGHAGALVALAAETAQAKAKILGEAGAHVAGDILAVTTLTAALLDDSRRTAPVGA